MTSLDDFLNKKKGSSTGTASSNSGGGTGMDDFFRKKKEKEIVSQPDTTTPTDSKVEESFDLSKIQETKPINVLPASQDPSMTNIGPGTLSTGQGVQIDRTNMEKQMKMDDDEKLRVKQADLVMGAEQMGEMFIKDLSEEDKDLMIAGLKNKEASITYQEAGKSYQKMQEKEKLQGMLKGYGEDVTPKIGAVDPTKPTYTTKDIIANKDTGNIPFLAEMKKEDRDKYVADLQALGPERNPRNPKDFGFFEDLRFDKEIQSEKQKRIDENKADDPMENISIALGIGTEQLKGTIGAMRAWTGKGLKNIGIDYGLEEDGMRDYKNAEARQKMLSTEINQDMDNEGNNASVFDSRFWTQKVPQSIPFMVALLPAALPGLAVGGTTAASLGLGEIGTFLMKSGMAGLTSRMAESMTEGGSVFADLKDRGVDDETASTYAWETAIDNMKLVFSDITQMAVTFAPVKKIPGLNTLIGRVAVPTVKFTFDATSEGGEEVFQGHVQQKNTKLGLGEKPLSIFEYLQTDEAREVFKLGAASGLAFGGLGVAKDAYDNFTDRAKAQDDMVQKAVDENDIDFIPKMEILKDKGAISEQTVGAVKTLLSLKLKEKTGQTYDQWVQAGNETRKQKIEETTASLKDLGTKIEEERKNASPEKMDFKNAKDLSSYFQEKTGDTIELAKTKIAGVEMRNRMRANGNPVGEVPTLEMEHIPYSKDQIKLIKKHQDLAKKSKTLFHTTTPENIQSIVTEGLQTGKAKRYDVSKEGKLYFSANEEAAKYFGSEKDVMIRVAKGYKFNDLGADILGGDGTYETTDNIPPEYLEVKKGGKWVPIKEAYKETTDISKKETPDTNSTEKPDSSKKEVSKQELDIMKRDYNNYQELYKTRGDERYKVDMEKELEKIRQVEPDFGKAQEPMQEQDIGKVVDGLSEAEKSDIEADYVFGSKDERTQKIGEEIKRRRMAEYEERKEVEMGKIQKEWRDSKQEGTYDEFVIEKMKELNKEYAQGMYELGINIEASQAGYRQFIYNTDAPGSTITGVSSSFPNWIPEHLRIKKLMEETFEYLANNMIIPQRNTRMRELADVFMQHLDPKLYIYGDEQGKNLKGTPIRKELAKPAESTAGKNNEGNPGNETGSTPESNDANNEGSNQDGGTTGRAKEEQTGTSKTGIVNALKKVDELVKTESVPEGQAKENESWEDLQKNRPDLFDTGILRRSQSPLGVKEGDEIPKSVYKAQHTWQHYGQYDEFQASRIYNQTRHKYTDDDGKYIEDKTGNIIEDTWDESSQEWIEATISNSDIRNELLDVFKTDEGSKYLEKVINALPKDKNGYITAYRIGNIGGEYVQSYTLSEGMAKTFSNIGTDIVPTVGMKKGGYDEFGGLKTNIVKIDPKGIEGWSPYDAEILVQSKYVQIFDKSIEKKVAEELDKDEKNKEFKDVGERVAGSKKENAKYKVISQDDLSKLEGESEVQAFNLVTKDRVVQDPYDPTAGRDAGEDAGIAYLKTKLWSAIQKKPENNKDSRSSYLRLVTEISGMIKEARSLEQLQVDLKQKFKKMHSRKGFGYFAEGHDIELGQNVLGQKFFNLVYGSTDASWQVTKDAVQKYRGRTQEMAIEQGKKELEHLGFRLEYAEKALGTIKETDSRYKGSQMNIEMLKQAIARHENPEVKEDNWEWLDGKRKESEKDTGNLPKEEGKGIGLHDFKTIESIIRTGGRQIDITYGSNEEAAKALQDNLGFKSAQFGNYVKDAERKDFIEQTIGAVYDLEDALEIDIVKLNRNAGLSIAFGARGGGKFAAHFESDHNIINLTKRKGAGSYGHEWGHFFDNAIGKLDKKDPRNFRYFLSESSETEKEKTKMDDAIIGVLDAMKNGEGTRQVVAKKTTGRRYMPQIREAYKTGGMEAAMKQADEMVAKKKTIYGSRWKLEDSKKIYSFVADEGKVDFVKFEEKTGKSEYFESAYNLDKGKFGYWSSNIELFARAFEGYIHHKLIEKGMTSNFLVDEEKMNPESDWFVAYPQGEERVKINAAFEKLFEEYKKQYGEKKYDQNTPRVKYQSGDTVIKEKNQGSESNTWIYDIVGSQYKTHPYSKQKIDISESYEEAMKLAPDGWKVRVDDATIENSLKTQDGAEMVAYADLENKVIMINKNEARKSTAAHESVHAHLSEIGDKGRRQILNAGKKQWEGVSGKSLDDNQVEEFIAEEFKYFIENKKYKTKTLLGKLREFIASLANRIKGVFGKDDKIKSFYEGILSGKIKAEGTNIGKKYQSAEDWRAREKEEYDKIDAENFGYKLPPKLGPEFQKSEAEKIPGKTWVSFKDFGEQKIVPIDSIIGSVSKVLKERLIKFEYGVANSDIMQESRIVMERMFDKIKDKKKTDEYRILDIALKNGNDEVMQYYADKLGISDEMKEVRKILDKIYEEAGLVGLDVKYREKYFPRTIKDSIGLLTYIYKTEFGSKIKEAIFYAEREAGHELTDEEKAVIANKMLMGWEVNGITLTPPGNTKARQIEQVTKELNPFYNDSMDSLVTYVAGMNEQIEARKLFGKGENLEDSIGSFMMDMIIKGEISAVDEARITRALKARFKKTSMAAFLQGYKGIAYLTTMGSPISAISQIQDLGFSLYENGFYRTGTSWGKAMVGKSKISVKDLGIENIMHEFKDPGKIQNAVSTVFKWVGLQYMDRVGKETMINAAYRKMQKEVLSGNLRSIMALDPKAQARVAEELRQDLVSDDIKYILFAKLCQYQPLTASQMPIGYLEGGNAKIAYMLKTYLIKQIDVIKQEAFNDMANSKLKESERAKALIRLLHIAACLMLMGMNADALKNLLLNRPFKLDDMVIDNILKIMGFSKYTVYQVKENTLSEGLLSIVIPPFNFFNDPVQDYYYFTKEKQNDGEDSGEKLHEWDPTKLQTINDIPVGGKLFYWWFGRGADKSDKRRGTDKPSTNIRETKSGMERKGLQRKELKRK